MNIRQAVLKAADHIESAPGDFDFCSVCVPHACGTPGCAVGWIQFYLGHRSGRIINGSFLIDGLVVNENVCGSESEFYSRMDGICAGRAWRKSAGACATTLRLYADGYHPAESRALIPASVRAIFEMTPAELAREFA